MPHFTRPRALEFIVMLGFFLVGCVAYAADNLYDQPQSETEKHISLPPTSGNVDRQAIQQGKTLFHGKAICFGCHGQNGDIHNVPNGDVAMLNPSPTDLRMRTDKSVRQIYLIIKYGISGTGMVPIQEATRLSEQEVLSVISYLLDLQGKPLSFETISHERFRRHTETDLAIAKTCEEEAIGDSDMQEYCEDRYSKRYRDLIIGRPPDISADRYTKIETRCKQQAAKSLDKLALCYRTGYSAARQAG